MEDMKHSRRFFLKSSGGAAALAGSMVIPIHNASAATPPAGAVSGSTSLPYPKKSVGKVGAMPVNQITNFSYPDASSPCYALRLGKPVVGGVGPNNDIVAYSTMCTHMGCPVAYDGGTQNLQVRLPLPHVRSQKMAARWCAARRPRTCPHPCSNTTPRPTPSSRRRRWPDLRPPIQHAVRSAP